MQSESKVAIIIITFNNEKLIVPQIESIVRTCVDDFNIYVFDNSTNKESAEAIEYHASRLSCVYTKTHSASQDPSQSHSFAANFAFQRVRDGYDYYLFLDHDCFPVKPFSVMDMLDFKVMAGVGQKKGDRIYLWPGCLMLGTFDYDLVNFSPLPGLDTGGSLYKIIEQYGEDKCRFFREEYFENPYYKGENPKYNFYSMIEGTFLHMIGGSGWEDGNEERINALLNVLQERCAASA